MLIISEFTLIYSNIFNYAWIRFAKLFTVNSSYGWMNFSGE